MGASYWPIRYRHNMEKADWISWAKWLPLQMLFGPFSILTSMPL